MNSAKRVLVIYYSLTEQTQAVLDRMKLELESVGHTVDMRKVKPIPEWRIPMSHRVFLTNWAKIWVGMNLTQPIEHIDLNPDDYDYIILGFQPWNLAPSIPINSFLDSPMAEIFRGKKVIGVVTCRARWERSFRIAKEKIEKRGGEMVDGFVIMNVQPEPGNFITTVDQLFFGGTKPDGWKAKVFDLKPYGIGDDSLAIAQDFGREVADRMLKDIYPNQNGWRVVNKPLSTTG